MPEKLFSTGNPMASRAKTYFDPKGIFLAPAGARGPQIENQPNDFVVHY